MVRITIKSVIAGIHRTKVGSNPKIELNVEADDSIPGIDPLCMLVRIPRKEQLPQEYLHLVTYPKSRNPNNKRNKDQLAYEVVGKKVGNVPTGLCGLFRQLKSSGKVRKISWYFILFFSCNILKSSDFLYYTFLSALHENSQAFFAVK